MEFYAYKVIQAFLLPPALIFFGILLSAILLKRKRPQQAIKVLGVVMVAYYALSVNAGASLLSASLERGISSTNIPSKEIKAIVILGGGASAPEGTSTMVELGQVSRERLYHGIDLYTANHGSIPIFYSGGSGDPSVPVSYEAQSAQVIAERMGVPNNRFFIESVSRTTAENSKAVGEWLKQEFPNEVHPAVILVTSSWHMRRAMAVLAVQGMRVEPSPVLDNTPFEHSILDFIPSERAFTNSTLSVHEWMGILGYQLMGRSR